MTFSGHDDSTINIVLGLLLLLLLLLLPPEPASGCYQRICQADLLS